MKETYDFPAFTAYCLEDDILHIELKKVKKLTAKDVEDIFSCHEKIGSGNKVYVLVTFNGFIPLSDEAMAEAKKQGKRNLQAGTAYVVHNFALRMGINFFMNFYKPKYPMTIVPSKAAALSWLKLQKKGNKK